MTGSGSLRVLPPSITHSVNVKLTAGLRRWPWEKYRMHFMVHIILHLLFQCTLPNNNCLVGMIIIPIVPMTEAEQCDTILDLSWSGLVFPEKDPSHDNWSSWRTGRPLICLASLSSPSPWVAGIFCLGHNEKKLSVSIVCLFLFFSVLYVCVNWLWYWLWTA